MDNVKNDHWHNYVQYILAQFSNSVKRPKVDYWQECKNDLPCDADFAIRWQYPKQK